MRVYVTAFLMLAGAGPLSAATLTVGDDGPADYNNIQAALTAAAPGDTISVADGVYTGPGNRALDPGGKAVTIASANGPARCVIDAQYRDRAFYFHNAETPDMVVDGFTLRHGYAPQGGAIVCANRACPTIRNCIVRDNYASDSGGGIHCENETAPVFDSCLIHANSADSSGGGLNAWYATVTLTRCVVSRNSSQRGGGLYVYSSLMRVTDCTLARNNAAMEGAGVYCNQDPAAFTNSVFTDNTAGTYGGALYAVYQGTLVLVTNCTFRGNSAGQRGGGIYGGQGAKLTATNSIFAAHEQHAILAAWEPELTFQNCLFFNNQPADYQDYASGETCTGGDQIDALSERNGQNLSADPGFALADDVRVVRGSACIDRGTNEPAGQLPAQDADGNPRSIDGNGDGAAVTDIGAFEYNPDLPVIAASPVDIEFIKEVDGADPAPAVVEIRNAGGGTLHWQAACDAAWLSVEPTVGVSSEQPGLMTLRADTQGMAHGLHQALLTVTDPQAVNDPRRLLVTLRIKGTLRVPDQYATIETALKAAMEGEMVEIGPGTYSECLTLRKRISLVGIGTPMIVVPPERGQPGITLTADGCLVDGFQIVGGPTGIRVASADNTVANNTITAADTGLEVAGQPSASAGASGNTLLNNDISQCRTVGLAIRYSTPNTLKNNRLHDNPENLRVTIVQTGDYAQDIDPSNTVDDKPIYYLVGQSNVTVGATSNAGCVVAVDCANLTIADLILRHNTHGVLLVNTRNSRIERVVAGQNVSAGIRLENSPNNTLLGNQVSECQCGIYLYRSANNALQDNRMNDNEFNFVCDSISPTDFRQSVTTSNRVDGKPIFYLLDQAHLTLNRSTNAACVFAVDCSDIRVCDLTLQDNGAGVTFVNTPLSTVENVVVRHNSLGGIILRYSDRGTVRRCIVSDNYDGIAVTDSTDVSLDSVRTCYNQQGIRGVSSKLSIANCYTSGNSGGGIVLDGRSTVDILNCTLCSNSGLAYSYPEPGGIAIGYGVQATIVNTILWGNSPRQIAGQAPVAVSYCDVQGGYQGEGNVNLPPLLTPDGHLCLGSPCIGKGRTRGDYPPYDMDGERRIPWGGIDIGADEYLDEDSDGLPDWWELGYFGDKAVAGTSEDPDEDGHTNLVEYELYSSEPNVPAAVYYVDAVRPDDSNDGLSWETAKKTIQAAIELADNSDRVYVAPGLYEENVTTLGRLVLLQGLDVEDPTIVAETVLAGTLTSNTGETPGCTIAGLTMSNPRATGLLCSGSSPTIRNCLITGNRCSDWRQGGGVTVQNAAPTLLRCTISGNLSADRGGGIYCQSSTPTLRNCVIVGNLSNRGYGGDGTALYFEQSNAIMENCTIAQNVNTQRGYSYSFGSAIWCQNSSLRITNSILWDTLLPNQVTGSDSSVRISYSDVKANTQPMAGLTLETGCLAVDPCFVASGTWDADPMYGAGQWVPGDYHLQSTGWRWTPYLSHGTHWVWDGQTSRCIDAGNPGDATGDEPVTVPDDPAREWGVNLRIDMGAYGGTCEASMAPHGWALRADIDNDGIVNLPDFSYLGEAFATRGRNPADVTRDAEVDYADLARLANDWLRVTDWSRWKLNRPRP
jgi:parallel beta-helix repeat protein/predicted outer membrane repeat protein